MPRDMQFLVEEHRTDLVHRDGRGEGGKHQQRIEKDGDHVTQYGHEGKRLLEHVRQGDENQRRSAIRLDTHREGSRENHQSCQNRDDGIQDGDLSCRVKQVDLFIEIARIGTQACGTQTQREERLSQCF